MNRPQPSRHTIKRLRRSLSRRDESKARDGIDYEQTRWYIETPEPGPRGVNPRVDEEPAPLAHPAFVSMPLLHLSSEADGLPSRETSGRRSSVLASEGRKGATGLEAQRGSTNARKTFTESTNSETPTSTSARAASTRPVSAQAAKSQTIKSHTQRSAVSEAGALTSSAQGKPIARDSRRRVDQPLAHRDQGEVAARGQQQPQAKRQDVARHLHESSQPRAAEPSRLSMTKLVVRSPFGSSRYEVAATADSVQVSKRTLSGAVDQAASHQAPAAEPHATSAAGSGNAGDWATATAGDAAGRRFRLDHADWIPAPHGEPVLKLGRELAAGWRGETPALASSLVQAAVESAPTPTFEVNASPIVAASTATTTPAAAHAIVENRAVESPKAESLQIQVVSGPGESSVLAELGSIHTDLDEVIGPKLETTNSQAKNEASAAGPIRAAWEVDDFRWPKLSSELLLSQGTVFEQLLRAIRQRDSSARILGVTGMREGEGRTTLSVCLARWAAMQGHNTLLVDGDLLRGKLVEASGLEFDSGWQSLEESSLPLSESLIRSAATSLTLFPLNSDRLATSSLPQAAKSLDRLLAKLRSHFDWIIVDSGTAQELSRYHLDSAPMIDVAVVVRNLQSSTPQELETAQRHLVGIGIRQLAVAENFGRRSSKAG